MLSKLFCLKNRVRQNVPLHLMHIDYRPLTFTCNILILHILYYFHKILVLFLIFFQELSIARKNAKTNKRLALQALKRKKRYDRQLQQVNKLTLKSIYASITPSVKFTIRSFNKIIRFLNISVFWNSTLSVIIWFLWNKINGGAFYSIFMLTFW